MNRRQRLLIGSAAALLVLAIVKLAFFHGEFGFAVQSKLATDSAAHTYATDPDAIMAEKLIPQLPLRKLTTEQMDLIRRLSSGNNSKQSLARSLIGYLEDPVALKLLLPDIIALSKSDQSGDFANSLLSSWRKDEGKAKKQENLSSAKAYRDLEKQLSPYATSS